MTEAQPWTTERLGEAVGVSGTYIRSLCAQGRIEGAYKVAKTWLIPDSVARQYIEERQAKQGKS